MLIVINSWEAYSIWNCVRCAYILQFYWSYKRLQVIFGSSVRLFWECRSDESGIEVCDFNGERACDKNESVWYICGFFYLSVFKKHLDLSQDRFQNSIQCKKRKQVTEYRCSPILHGRFTLRTINLCCVVSTATGGIPNEEPMRYRLFKPNSLCNTAICCYKVTWLSPYLSGWRKVW